MATGGESDYLTLRKPILFWNVSGLHKLHDLSGQDSAFLLFHEIICLTETWDTEARKKPNFFQRLFGKKDTTKKKETILAADTMVKTKKQLRQEKREQKKKEKGRKKKEKKDEKKKKDRKIELMIWNSRKES